MFISVKFHRLVGVIWYWLQDYAYEGSNLNLKWVGLYGTPLYNAERAEYYVLLPDPSQEDKLYRHIGVIKVRTASYTCTCSCVLEPHLIYVSLSNCDDSHESGAVTVSDYFWLAMLLEIYLLHVRTLPPTCHLRSLCKQSNWCCNFP